MKEFLEATKIRSKEVTVTDEKGNDKTVKVKESQLEYCTRVYLLLFELLQERGRFIVENGIYYYFYTKEKRTYRVSEGKSILSNEFQIHIGNAYGLTISDRYAKPIFERLFIRVSIEAITVKLHKLSFYDKKNNLLYVRKSNTEWFKVSEDTIKVVSNGTDNIFAKDTFQNVEFIEGSEGYLYKNFINKIWFTSRNLWVLNQSDKNRQTLARNELLLKFWILSIFFKEIMAEKPILVVSGDAGTGKTTILQNIGNIIYSNDFTVSGMLSDERNFVAQVIQSQLVAVDNVDEDMPKWFADKLAGVATGMGFNMRRLYKDVDDQNLVIKPECFIGITTRTPKFNRDDIADRCAVLTLDKMPNQNHSRIDIERNRAFSSILIDLQKILRNFKDNENYKQKSPIRMVSFANFVYKASKNDKYDFLTKMLLEMRDSQLDFAMEEKPVIDALVELSTKKPGRYSLDTLLQKLNIDYSQDLKNTFQLGCLLRDNKGLISKKMKFTKEKTGGRTYYTIGESVEINNTSLVEQIGL